MAPDRRPVLALGSRNITLSYYSNNLRWATSNHGAGAIYETLCGLRIRDIAEVVAAEHRICRPFSFCLSFIPTGAGNWTLVGGTVPEKKETSYSDGESGLVTTLLHRHIIPCLLLRSHRQWTDAAGEMAPS